MPTLTAHYTAAGIRLTAEGGVNPAAPTTVAAAFVPAAKSDPGAAAGRIAENLRSEGQEAAGPWLGLAVFALGVALLIRRDKRLVLIGSMAMLILGAVLIFAGDQVVALIRGIIDRATA